MLSSHVRKSLTPRPEFQDTLTCYKVRGVLANLVQSALRQFLISSSWVHTQARGSPNLGSRLTEKYNAKMDNYGRSDEEDSLLSVLSIAIT